MRISAELFAGLCLSWSSAAPLLAATSTPEVQVADSATTLMVAAKHPTAALVIFPGAFLKASQYQDLAAAVVRQSHGTVAVLVPHFSGDFANPLEASDRVSEAVALLAQQGLKEASHRVFVAGHSQGGIAANEVPASLDLGGLILLGSYLPHTALIGKDLGVYPYPTLTLGGELDGMTGLNYLARESATVASLAQTDPSARSKKPVIVLAGVSHMQFADGSHLDGDSMLPELSLSAAHEAMAQVITEFMAAQIGLDGFASVQVKAELSRAVLATETLVQPYAAAQARENAVCAQLQPLSTPLADPAAWSQIKIDSQIYHHGLEDLGFILDKASATKTDSGYVLHLPVQIDQEIDLADVSQDHWLAPRSLRCKMRSGDKLAEETGFAAKAGGQSCAQLNAVVIKDALALLQPTQVARLAAKYGPLSAWTLSSEDGQEAHSVQYGPFQIRSDKQATGQDWVVAPFNLERTAAGTWNLLTAELVTAKDFPVQLFAGANYCKVLAPARVVEWATVFGLK